MPSLPVLRRRVPNPSLPRRNAVVAGLDPNTRRVVRVFDAPREGVYDAFARQDQYVQWVCPPGVQVEHCTLDVRPGGLWQVGGRSTRGAFAMSGTYLEIV